MTEQQWKKIQPQLKASAYFALGRAYASSGLADSASPHGSELNQALQALNSAAAWNPDDPEIFYLRALVELGSRKQFKASSDMAFVARASDSLGEKARAQLQKIYNHADRKAGLDFEGFLKSLPPPEIDPALRQPEADRKPSAAIQEGYAGSAACQSCHQREYDTWRQTGMAKMLREYRPEYLIGDFSPGTQFRDESGKPLIRMGIDKRPYFEFNQSGSWQRFYVDYTIGSKWQQGYATRLPDGSFHVFPIEYNALRKIWINYWEIIDPPGSERAIISDFPKMLPATNYQQNCAICHTSQLRAAGNSEDPLQHALFKEPGVNCEMCHGPSAWHVRRMKSGQTPDKSVMEPPIDFHQIGNREGVRICAQCHRQTAVRQIGANREMNYSAETANYVPRTWSRAYDSFSRRALYKDGRFRESTFIVEAFSRSACYRKGTAQCASCHAPHVQISTSNPNCVKFNNNQSEICLQCHSQYRGRVSEHTHHAADSEAGKCVSCHMPRIMNALLFEARSHEIEIPRADLTERFGQKESPNACLLCHTEKTAEWANRELEHWKN
jgi:predicted CXXCH cytochrome family protein